MGVVAKPYIYTGRGRVEVDVVLCNEHRCVLSDEGRSLLDELGCRVFVRLPLAELLIYDKVLNRGTLYNACKRGRLRCLFYPIGRKKHRLYICFNDLIAYMVSRAGRDLSIGFVLDRLYYVILYMLYSCYNVEWRDVESLTNRIWSEVARILGEYLKLKRGSEGVGR